MNFYLRNADDTNDNVKYCETKVDISNRTYNADIDLNNLSRDGNYYVIMRLDDSWDTYFRDLMLRKESGDVFFVSNTDILSNNERIREEGNKVKPESYLDVSLKDDYIYGEKIWLCRTGKGYVGRETNGSLQKGISIPDSFRKPFWKYEPGEIH